jgi:hypothetical protein
LPTDKGLKSQPRYRGATAVEEALAPAHGRRTTTEVSPAMTCSQLEEQQIVNAAEAEVREVASRLLTARAPNTLLRGPHALPCPGGRGSSAEGVEAGGRVEPALSKAPERREQRRGTRREGGGLRRTWRWARPERPGARASSQTFKVGVRVLVGGNPCG